MGLRQGNQAVSPARDGQDDAEAGPASGGTLDLQAAPVVLHDSVRDAQTQTSAVTDRLGGEEGIEDLRQDLRGDAAAIVNDLDDHVLCVTLSTNDNSTVLLVRRLDRLHGVDQQVQKNLVDLHRGCRDRWKFALLFFDGDMPAVQPAADHLECRAQSFLDVDLVDGGSVKAGEASKVVHDLGHALDALPRAAQDLVEVLLDIKKIALLVEPIDLAKKLWPVRRQQIVGLLVDRRESQERPDVPLENSQVVGDVGQGIVDLVGHAGTQHAERGEFLGLDDSGVHLVAIDELADLAPQVGHHFEQSLVGRARHAAEKLEHAQAFAAHQDRNGNTGAQAVRGCPAREIRVMGQLADPRALAGRPDTAGKAGTRGERDLARHFLKVGERSAGTVPERDAPQLVYPLFESPERSDVPVQALADDLQNQGNRLSQRIDLGQYSSCGVLDSKPLLVILEAGDVVEDDHSTLDLALVIPQGSGVDQHP